MRDDAGVAAQAPLTTLLSWTWVAFTIEADNAVEAAGSNQTRRLFRISMAMWANGLRLIDEEGITVGELRARAHAACNMGGLERWGWISVGDAPTTRRDGYGTHRGVSSSTVVRPTRAGAYARRLWPERVADVERRWSARFGPGAVDSLRESLLPWVGTMPWSPPEVHPSDGFYTRVIQEAAADQEGSADDGAVPLPALLGQALTSLTLEHEHERDSRVSLPLAANVLRVIGDQTVRTRDLPPRSGVSKEGIAMATGFLSRTRLAALGPGPSIGLTAAGHRALDDYRTRAAHEEDRALRASLEAIVSQPEAMAEGLLPPDGCWRGCNPYLRQTRRMLADPTGALPWHPMVLHRGGWPDAS